MTRNLQIPGPANNILTFYFRGSWKLGRWAVFRIFFGQHITFGKFLGWDLSIPPDSFPSGGHVMSIKPKHWKSRFKARSHCKISSKFWSIFISLGKPQTVHTKIVCNSWPLVEANQPQPADPHLYSMVNSHDSWSSISTNEIFACSILGGGFKMMQVISNDSSKCSKLKSSHPNPNFRSKTYQTFDTNTLFFITPNQFRPFTLHLGQDVLFEWCPTWPILSLKTPGHFTWLPNLFSKLLRLDRSSVSGINFAHNDGSVTAFGKASENWRDWLHSKCYR